MDELREKLADYAHEAWGLYMVWMLANCEQRPDGSVLISAGYAAALQRLATASYAELPEDQKNNDRAEADKILAIVRSHGG